MLSIKSACNKLHHIACPFQWQLQAMALAAILAKPCGACPAPSQVESALTCLIASKVLCMVVCQVRDCYIMRS